MSGVSVLVLCVSHTRVLQCSVCLICECFSVLRLIRECFSVLSHTWVLQCSVCLVMSSSVFCVSHTEFFSVLCVSYASTSAFCVSHTWVLHCSVCLIREFFSVLCVSYVSSSVFCVSYTWVLQCSACLIRECFSVVCVSYVSSSLFCVSHTEFFSVLCVSYWVLQCSHAIFYCEIQNFRSYLITLTWRETSLNKYLGLMWQEKCETGEEKTNPWINMSYLIYKPESGFTMDNNFRCGETALMRHNVRVSCY